MNIDAIISRCRNYTVAGSLDWEVGVRLRRVLRNPTQETWEDAYSIIVSNKGRTNTLWQAWLAIDPDAPRSKPHEGPWPRVPDVVTLRRAILAATVDSAST